MKSPSVFLNDQPVLHLAQGRLGRAGRFEVGHRREHDRQFRFIHCIRVVFLIQQDREGLAPVSLPAEEPIAELEGNRTVAGLL